MSKSENKKSAPPKTPVASRAGNATGQMEPTPRPWEVRKGVSHDYPSRRIVGRNGLVAEVRGAGGPDRIVSANAELICRAVNNHEELLKALKRIERAFWKQFANPIEEIKSIARAAIAKAEGRAS